MGRQMELDPCLAWSLDPVHLERRPQQLVARGKAIFLRHAQREEGGVLPPSRVIDSTLAQSWRHFGDAEGRERIGRMKATNHLRGDVEIVAGSARMAADDVEVHPSREAAVRGNERVGVVRRRWWRRSRQHARGDSRKRGGPAVDRLSVLLAVAVALARSAVA
jgi:hypothetical protein